MMEVGWQYLVVLRGPIDVVTFLIHQKLNYKKSSTLLLTLIGGLCLHT